MRLPTRSPDAPEGVVGRLVTPEGVVGRLVPPEGVVGRLVPTAAESAIPVRELVEAFCLEVAELDGVASPLFPLLVLALLAVCLGDVAAVCLGDADVFEAAVVRLARLTGVVGIEVRPL